MLEIEKRGKAMQICIYDRKEKMLVETFKTENLFRKDGSLKNTEKTIVENTIKANKIVVLSKSNNLDPSEFFQSIKENTLSLAMFGN